jgi:hypothetical protein
MAFAKKLTASVDHLIVTAPDLESGSRWIADRLGILPVTGGQHPHWGTHNALLGLGENTYLEVLAPDPGLTAPERGRWLHDLCLRGPGLSTWAMQSSDIATDAQAVVDLGIPLGTIQSGSRQQPDGRILSWQLTDPYALPYSGVFPFLIDWGATAHPGTRLPQAGALETFQIQHPQAGDLNTFFQHLGVQTDIIQNSDAGIIATINVNGQKISLPGLHNS